MAPLGQNPAIIQLTKEGDSTIIDSLAFPLAGIAYGKIKGGKRILLVVPAGLHRQWKKAALDFFKTALIPLREKSQLRAYHIDKPIPTTGPTLFFITSYHEIGFNGTRRGNSTMAAQIRKFEDAGGGFDTLIVDEGTRLQGTETHISIGVRLLNPKYRLLLTGTPIKNRLEIRRREPMKPDQQTFGF